MASLPGWLHQKHPALLVLLSVDVAAAAELLRGAVLAWDALETDLLAAAGKAVPQQLDCVRVATQVRAWVIVCRFRAAIHTWITLMQ